MAKFRVTAEVKTRIVLEVEATDERAAVEEVVSGDTGKVLVPKGTFNGWPASFGDVSVHRLGHGFDRAKVKNLIARLSDEDADAIAELAGRGYRHGLKGLYKDAECRNAGVPELFEGVDGEWTEDGTGAAIAELTDRLGLGDEITGIYAEAHEAGLRDGGHRDPEDCGLS